MTTQIFEDKKEEFLEKKIKIKTKILMRSISYVRNTLKISPKLIRIK